MISIIVPIYNVEKYLTKCIDSLISQTYQDVEIILVDDGSHDESARICDEYANKDLRIKVIHKQNGGVSSARNAGLAIAKGEYIGFVDPDDWVSLTMYEDMLTVIKDNSEVDLVICGYDYVKEDGNTDRFYRTREDELLLQKEMMSRMSDLPPTVRHGVVNKLFRKNVIGAMQFDESLHSSEDVLFVTQYVEKINSAVFVHKPLYMNLIRDGSATRGGLSAEKLAKSFAVHENMYISTVSKYPDLRDHALAFLMDILVLKYKEICKQKDKKHLIKRAKRFIKKYAIRCLFNREIYWKTRIYYLIMS